MTTESKIGNKLDGSLKMLIFWQLKDYWPAYTFGIITLILTHYLQSFLPFWAKEIADMTDRSHQIYWPKFIYIAVGIVVFRSLSRLLFFNPARYLQLDMRNEILYRVENCFPDRYKEHSSGQIYQILFADIDNVRGIVGFALMQIMNGVIAFAVLFPRLIAFNPQLVIAFIPMFLFFFIFVFVMVRLRKYFEKGQEYQGDIQNFLMEVYDAKKTIKNFNAESAFERVFSSYSNRELDVIYQGGLRMSTLIPLVPLGIGLSFVLGVYYIHLWNMDVSTIILFSGFTFLFIGPLSFLMWVGGVLSRGQASWIRVKNLLTLLATVTPLENDLKKLNSNIEYNSSFNLSVPFWNSSVELTVLKNSWHVLIGETGVGKSEVLKRMAMILKQHKRRVSYVAQSPYLYNDTISNNIFMGKQPSSSELEQALELLDLMGLNSISGAKDILSLEVGENGKLLSGGQIKRIALIRSLMAKPEIILWDDPFSSVDLILEKEILIKLQKSPLIKNITFVLTSHRLSTVRYCQSLCYLSVTAGIVEEGETITILGDEKSLSYEYFKDQLV